MMIFDVVGKELVQKCSFKVADWPRHFALTPEGNLLVACQKGNVIQRYMLKDDKIYMLSEMSIDSPSVVVPYAKP